MGFSPGAADASCVGLLCSPRPRPLQNLLLLWTLLSCGLGVSAQGLGEWTPWGPWTRCSSSCGRGVSVRSRRCIRFPAEQPCPGDSREYRLCQLPDCSPGAVPFRNLQCALYNGRPVLGTQETYQWVPFHGAPNQCDLNCLAEGQAFYHSFGRVLDGTPCSPGAQGLCVAGRCLVKTRQARPSHTHISRPRPVSCSPPPSQAPPSRLGHPSRPVPVLPNLGSQPPPSRTHPLFLGSTPTQAPPPIISLLDRLLTLALPLGSPHVYFRLHLSHPNPAPSPHPTRLFPLGVPLTPSGLSTQRPQPSPGHAPSLGSTSRASHP